MWNRISNSYYLILDIDIRFVLDINLWSELMFKPSIEDDMYFYLTVSVFHIDVYIQVKLFIQSLYCLVYFKD